MSDYFQLIQQCENEIRNGRVNQVRKLLSDINMNRVPRESALPLANICRRAGLYSAGLRLLSKIIYPAAGGELATPNERAEYAVLLIRSGALTEAIKILDGIRGSEAPEALLFRSYAHFAHWEFAEATEKLKSYIVSTIDDYSRFVGRVNLTFALAHSGFNREAMVMLNENVAIAEEKGFSRLGLNSRVLRAQVFINDGDYSSASSELASVRKMLGSESALNNQLVLKWSAVLATLQTQDLEPVEKYQKVALLNHDFDGFRETEFYALKVRFDQDRFHRLVFGTPYQRCRDRICNELGKFPVVDHYIFGSAQKTGRCMDLSTGEVNGNLSTNAGTKTHQLYDVLLRDFYCPLKIGGLFSQLFPGEYFDSSSSPDRVHQIILRARQWAIAEGFPLEIREGAGFYKLNVGKGFSFKIPLHRPQLDPMNMQHERLCRFFPPDREFSAREASIHLKVSQRTVQRLIRWAIENKKIERVGKRSLYRRWAA